MNKKNYFFALLCSGLLLSVVLYSVTHSLITLAVYFLLFILTARVNKKLAIYMQLILALISVVWGGILLFIYPEVSQNLADLVFYLLLLWTMMQLLPQRGNDTNISLKNLTACFSDFGEKLILVSVAMMCLFIYQIYFVYIEFSLTYLKEFFNSGFFILDILAIILGMSLLIRCLIRQKHIKSLVMMALLFFIVNIIMALYTLNNPVIKEAIYINNETQIAVRGIAFGNNENEKWLLLADGVPVKTILWHHGMIVVEAEGHRPDQKWEIIKLQ